jgi:hypothetical protein
MAELLLHASRLVHQTIASETPLSALAAGSLDRARELARLHEPERATLWMLLIAWELVDAGRIEDARITLESLAQSTTLPHLSRWQGYAAAHALAATVDAAGDRFPTLRTKILGGEKEVSSLGILPQLAGRFAREGRFDLALETAAELVAGNKNWVLEDIAALQAEHRQLDEALNTVERIESPWGEAAALAAIAAVLANQNIHSRSQELFASSLRRAKSSQLKSNDRDRALTAVAVSQIAAGHSREAVESIGLIGDPVEKCRAYARAVEKQVETAQDAGTTLKVLHGTVKRIENKQTRMLALSVAAPAFARAGDQRYIELARQSGTTAFSHTARLVKSLAEALGDAGRFDEASALPDVLGPLERRLAESVERDIKRMRPGQLARAGKFDAAKTLIGQANFAAALRSDALAEIAGAQVERNLMADARSTITSILADARDVGRSVRSEAAPANSHRQRPGRPR